MHISTHIHTQHFAPIVSHSRQWLEELLVLLSTGLTLHSKYGSLWNQTEGIIMQCLLWQQQNPIQFSLSLCESLNSHHCTHQQMAGKKKKDTMHIELLKANFIFWKFVLVHKTVYRTVSLPTCVKSFHPHRHLRCSSDRTSVCSMQQTSKQTKINTHKKKIKANQNDYPKIPIRKSQKGSME